MVCSTYILFFFNDTATPEIYTLSLHDALPISKRFAAAAAHDVGRRLEHEALGSGDAAPDVAPGERHVGAHARSEEHTSELQSRQYLVCRLLLEKKNHNSLYYI